MPGQERINDRLVLLGLARAGRIDEPAVWPYQGRGAFEEAERAYKKAIRGWGGTWQRANTEKAVLFSDISRMFSDPGFGSRHISC